jgi:uncharacterized protein
VGEAALEREPTVSDRLAMRQRSAGSPIMHQTWDDLLFLHWPVAPQAIRPLIPKALQIDTFEDQAWIAITPFALNDLRLAALPPIPGLSSFLEVNVRTYVRYGGTPGVWFFSLDASKVVPTVASRLLFLLPYFNAHIEFEQNGELCFTSTRSHSSAHLRTAWRVGPLVGVAEPGSLAFFLVERYSLFSTLKQNLRISRIHHPPWLLNQAQVLSHESSMISELGLPEPKTPPLAHFSRTQAVEIWPHQAV